MPTDQELIKIVPSKRQLKYQETEFYAFFSLWDEYVHEPGNGGDGTEDPGSFLIRRNSMPGNGYRR